MNHEVTKGRITIRTATRTHIERGRNEYESDVHTERHVVEVWLGGVCFETRANNLEHAIELVRTTAIDLGVKP